MLGGQGVVRRYRRGGPHALPASPAPRPPRRLHRATWRARARSGGASLAPRATALAALTAGTFIPAVRSPSRERRRPLAHLLASDLPKADAGLARDETVLRLPEQLSDAEVPCARVRQHPRGHGCSHPGKLRRAARTRVCQRFVDHGKIGVPRRLRRDVRRESRRLVCRLSYGDSSGGRTLTRVGSTVTIAPLASSLPYLAMALAK